MKRYELRRGDMCPCCGQMIQTDDPVILRELTDFAQGLGFRDFETTDGWLRRIGFEWPEDEKGEENA